MVTFQTADDRLLCSLSFNRPLSTGRLGEDRGSNSGLW